MLKNMFNKMDDNEEKRKMNDKEILFLLIIIVILISMAVFIGFSVRKAAENNEKEENTVSIAEIFNQMQKNYSIIIEKKENEKTLKLTIDCDDDVCIYGSSVLPYGEIVRYDEKWYTLKDKTDLNENNLIETDNKEINNNFNELYYNLNLVKSVIEVSNRESMENSVIKSNVSLERYLKEYNYVYSKIYKTDKDITIPIKLVVSSTKIDSIEIDYREIDKFFNNTDFEELTYKIEIKSININDFSSVREFFNR